MAEKKDSIVTKKFTHKGVTFTLTEETRSNPITPEQIAIDVFDKIGADGVKALWELRDPITNYPPEVSNLIHQANPEISKMWVFVWSVYKAKGRDTNEEKTSLEILQSSCLAWIGRNETNVLRRDFFEDSYIFSGEQYPNDEGLKRLIIGRLCKVIISHYLPDILPSPEEEQKYYGYKSLYKLEKSFDTFIQRIS